jgi:AcrR family transcriptional regulator
MSELTPTQRGRRRRAEAGRSIAAILDAAMRVLGERPEASVDEIASAAGVSRQTVYAHYSSREALLKAVIDRVTDEVVAAMDAASLDEGPAAAALFRLLDAGWHTMKRYPWLQAAFAPIAQQEEDDLHQPILDRLARLIRRGQDAGEFDRRLSPTWLVATTIALGHAAGEEVGAGRMTADEATAALRHSILRVFGADEPPPARQAGEARDTG